MTEAETTDSDREFLDREYNPRTQVPNFAEIFARWKTQARETRESLPGRLDLRYGASTSETLDFFPATAPQAPLLIFIHGGYWRALDKADFSWVAPAYVSVGVSVAILNYGLAPATSVPEIVRQIRRACAWLYLNAESLAINPRSIVCAGHSAGGHMTAMMLATDWPQFSPQLPQRLLASAVSISGIYDLEPLTRAEFLRHDLKLDYAGARALSPAYLPLRNEVPVLRAVGVLESKEFLRQSNLIAQHWPSVCTSELIRVPHCNHLTVCDAFANPESALFSRTRSLM